MSVSKYLEMESISKNYPGVRALKSVNFDADAGEIVALVGENGAGKSTLMNILGGVDKRDGGIIRINGSEVNINNVSDAQREGIAFIHQELSLFKQLSVQENLFIDDLKSVKSRLPFIISKAQMSKKTKQIFKELDIAISPLAKVGSLPMSEQQMVEIAAAIIKDAKIFIFDEPTTSLAQRECEKLHEIMHKLRSEGKVLIYITHDINNAITMSDRVICLRDGENAGEMMSEGATKPNVVAMMIGSKGGKTFVKSERRTEDVKVLEFKNVHTLSKLNGVSMTMNKGEVLGVYGLVGSGRTELVRALYGFDKIVEGDVLIDGETLPNPSPRALKNRGFAWLTENRRDEGLFLELSVHFNVIVTNLRKFASKVFAVMDREKEHRAVNEMVSKLQIVTPNIDQLAGKLSGGNQQKIVIAKWLHLNPRVFILDEPTKGIDVGAKNEIYRLIDQIANAGVSILLISSEIEEIIEISDRVVVMANGQIAGELAEDEINNSNIVKFAMS